MFVREEDRGEVDLNSVSIKLKLLLWFLAMELTCTLKASVTEQYQDGDALSVEGELLRRLPRLSKRMRKMCLVFMKESPLPHLVESLDQFTGECQQLGQKSCLSPMAMAHDGWECGVCVIFDVLYGI